MSVRTDVVNLIVNIGNDAAKSKLNDLRKKAADVTSEMQALKKGTQAYIDKSKELSQVTKEMDNLKKKMDISTLSQKELNAELRKLSAIKSSIQPFTAEFNNLEKQIKAVKERIVEVKSGVQGFGSAFSKIGDEIKKFSTIAVAYLGFQFITSQFQNVIKGAGKLSDQLADLQRVAGFTADEADNLNNKLKDIDTRTSAEGLREIAIVAGKLGVAKNDIFEFTKSVDQLVVTLGDELGNADQITTQLGKILNVFDGKVNGENISKLGNAFVELANTGSATGGFIAEFDQRLASIAKTSGVSLGALSGLGAGMEELGAKVEVSTSGIQNLLINVSGDLQKAAKIAGKSTEEFTKLFNVNPVEAILQYSEGLTKNKNNFAEVTASLKNAGEEGIRTVGTLTLLGENADKLRGRIALGTEAIKDNAAITTAFNIKNETLAANLDKLGKEFNNLVSNNAVTGFLKSATAGLLSFISSIKKLPEFIQENRFAITSLIVGIVLLNKTLILSSLATIKDSVAKAYNAVVTRLVASTSQLAVAAQAAYITITNLLAGRITIATAAQRLYNIALSFGAAGLGAIVAVAAGAVLIFSAFAGKTKELTAAQRAQLDVQSKISELIADEEVKAKSLFNQITKSNLGYVEKTKLLAELIALNPQYLGGLTLENIKTEEGTKILDGYIGKLREANREKAIAQVTADKEKRAAELQNKINDSYTVTKDANGNVISKTLTNKDNSLFGAVKSIFSDNEVATLQKNEQELQKVNDELTSIYNEMGAKVKETVAQGNEGSKDIAAVAIRNIESIKAQIKSLDESFEKINVKDKNSLNKNRSDRKKLQDELDSLEGKKSKKTGTDTDTTKGKYEKIKEDFEKFQLELAEIKRKNDVDGLEGQEKEIATIQNKYDELLKRAAKYYEDLNAKDKAANKEKYTAEQQLIDEAYQQEILAASKKFIALKATEEQSRNERNYKGAQAGQKDIEEQNRLALKQQYAAGTIDKATYEKGLVALAKSARENEITTAENWAKKSKQAAKDVVEFKKLQEGELTDAQILENEKRAENEAKAKDDKIQAAKDRIDEIIQYAQQIGDIFGGINQLMANKENALLQKDKAANEAKKKAFKDQLDQKLISKGQYDKKVTEADLEMDKKERALKRKQAERDKALNIFTAVINTATAIVRALNNPYPLNLILAAAAGVMGGIQIATISSQPLPELGKGDWIRNGDKHSDASGGINAKIERDEAVMSAAAMKNSKRFTISGSTAQITSALNSRAGGTAWASGASILPMWATAMPARINPGLPKIMEQGGIIRPLNNGNLSGLDNSEFLLSRVISLLEEGNVITKAKHDKIQAVVSIKQLDETREKYDAAKKASGF